MNNANNDQKLIANAPLYRKIGFFSAILMVIGSAIGAGIFFKSSTVLSNSGNNLIFAIISWIVAAVAIVALGLALIEITSSQNDNLGMIGWNKTFSNKHIYKMCKNFMVFISLPLTYFYMPFYFIMSFQDGLTGFGLQNNFGTNVDWLIWLLIVLLISAWFILVPGIFSKIGNYHNWVIMAVKFIPLVVASVLGFVVMYIEGHAENLDITHTKWITQINPETTFFKISPLIGIFGSLAAIFFAYDGFYLTAGIQTEMKNPKKLPLAIIIGIGIITFLYLIIAISMSLGTKGGSFSGFGDWLKSKNAGWVFGVVNIAIAFGVLGIINGYSMWGPRFLEHLMKTNELYCPTKWKNKFSDETPIIGGILSMILTIIPVVSLTIIGALAYIPGQDYIGVYEREDSNSMASLYTFVDLISTWLSVIAFIFLATAIIGGLKNRRTNKIKTVKSRFFVPSAIIAIVIVFISMIISIIQPFVDLALAIHYQNHESIIGNLMLIIVFVAFLIIMLIPSLYEWIKSKRTKKPVFVKI
ncbi:APC family permease [Mycoplasmopsis sturni]|uniref:APC family permease n=1 Tax=Mycoplasmopsis sturni TaxID=39047 RepID=UPI000691C7C9|nr:APC family permease [Mycoplasmopsis sturni]